MLPFNLSLSMGESVLTALLLFFSVWSDDNWLKKYGGLGVEGSKPDESVVVQPGDPTNEARAGDEVCSRFVYEKEMMGVE